MKEKIKKFYEEHQTAFTCAGIGLMAATWGFVGYKVGSAEKTAHVVKKITDDLGIQAFLEAHAMGNNMYGHTFSPERRVAFKELDKLAKSAIAFDASHLEDKVIGMFVVTES